MTRTEFNPAKLGVFVVGALALAVVALCLWGPLNGFVEKKYVIFFPEPATGLDVDAKVLLNGVNIGKVDSVHLYFRSTNGIYYSAVVVQLDLKKVKGTLKGGATIEEMLAKHEISAEMGISGVVSFKLDVELQLDSREGDRTWTNSEYQDVYGGNDWIPAKLSMIAEVTKKVKDLLNSPDITNLISSVDTILKESHDIGLVERAGVLMSNVNVFTTNLNELTTNLNRALVYNTNHFNLTLSNLDDIVAYLKPRLPAIMANLNDATTSVTTNMAWFGSNTDSMASNLASITTNLNPNLADLDVILRRGAPLPPQLMETLRSLQDTSESLQRLLDNLDRRPESIIWGRAKEK
jgi:ABC-type transporter Mla subunit MlaD